MEPLVLATKPSVTVSLFSCEWSKNREPIVASFSEDLQNGILIINLDDCECGNIDIQDLLLQLKDLQVITDVESWELVSMDDNSGDTVTSFGLYTCVKIKRK